MFWSNFIHIYQPPTQTFEIVEKVTNESYRTLVRILQKFDKAKITLNINASLTEQFAKYRFDDVIGGLKELAQDRRIEFTASAKYHPILPLLPDKEIKRQIELNTETNRKYFGDNYSPTGFFPPEMCYSEHIAKIIKDLGYKWIIIDEVGFNGKLGQVKNDKIYKIKNLENFFIFFKERNFSAGLTYGKYPGFNEFIADINDLNKNYYLLTGTDGEIYGHHRPGQELLLSETYESGLINTCTISELFRHYKEINEVNPLSCSWSTWEKELKEDIPFPQWNYPGNEIHKLQWELAYLIIDLLNNTDKNSENYEIARDLLDKGLHSCQWWWASARPWWDTGMIKKGAEQLYSSIDILKETLDLTDTKKAFDLKEKIVKNAKIYWESGKATKLKQEYMKEFTEVENELSFG
ncbi:MAG: polysaccharide deacetylase family protein [Candidatus Gastranaerophilales bacterium]|nr:polysaccharide deacetylase family protein [Candidatus Gastranaerophilales bacterium]